MICRHCGARLYAQPGHAGRWALTDSLDDTKILGSGSECPANDSGHEAKECNESPSPSSKHLWARVVGTQPPIEVCAWCKEQRPFEGLIDWDTM